MTVTGIAFSGDGMGSVVEVLLWQALSANSIAEQTPKMYMRFIGLGFYFKG
jgi:hypothetical protein